MLLLFPSQLLSSNFSSQYKHVLVVKEHDVSKKRNKLRLVYHQYCMQEYIYNLKQKFVNTEVIIGNLNDLEIRYSNQLTNPIAFDPEDHTIKSQIKKLGINVTWLDSPSFLTSSELLEEYAQSAKGKRLQHKPFYQFVKDRVLSKEIPGMNLPDSQDHDNRKPLPKNFDVPHVPWGAGAGVSAREPDADKFASMLKCAEWVEEHYPNNPGPRDLKKAVREYLVYIPSNHEEAQAWWKQFLKERFASFGPYEDAIVRDEPVLFHSYCSILLNNGLLTPLQILKDLTRHYNALPIAQQKAQLSSYEGFVRQVAGWREFSRLYYRVVPPKVYLKNALGHTGRLGTVWYKPGEASKTGLPPIVQDAVNDAWERGYLHHIQRLMVVSNYMNLCGIHPKQVYKWMYEFALDSWEWVMVFNVYSMGTWSDGGHAMRKPYISSPAYLLRMSNYPRGPWVDEWKKKYDAFLVKHRELLRHTPLARFLTK
jgi:deoxyribodipyrimidine photolyase-related protein